MLQTSNYSLNKPESTDVVDIEVLNENFDTLDTELKKVSDKANYIQTAGGTGTAITLNNVTLINGFTITFVVAANNNGATTTINGKYLYKPGGTAAPTLTAGKAVTVWYNGTNFFIKASAEGDASDADVLAGKKYSNDADTGRSGTMPNNGAVSVTLTSQSQEYTVPKGYHSGLGKIKAVLTGLAANIIKAGATVGGIIGTFTSDATATAAQMLAGVTAYINGAKVTGTMLNYSNIAYPNEIRASAHTRGPIRRQGTDITDWYFTNNANGYVNNSEFSMGIIGLVSENIKAGVHVGGSGAFGMDGSFTSDANAVAGNIISGKTAYVNGVKVTGNIPVLGSEEYQGWRKADVFYAPIPDLGRVHLRIPLGAYLTGAGEQNGLLGVYCDDPDYAPTNILSTANIFGLQGAIPVKNADIGDSIPASRNGATLVGDFYGNGLHVLIAVDPYTYINNANWVRSYQPYLQPQYILNTANIFGIQGSAIAGKRYASGTVVGSVGAIAFTFADNTSGSCYYATVNGLNFTPKTIVMHASAFTSGIDDYTIFDSITGTVKYFRTYSRAGSQQTAQFLLTGNAYVTYGAFQLPTSLYGGTYTWEAYE